MTEMLFLFAYRMIRRSRKFQRKNKIISFAPIEWGGPFSGRSVGSSSLPRHGTRIEASGLGLSWLADLSACKTWQGKQNRITLFLVPDEDSRDMAGVLKIEYSAGYPTGRVGSWAACYVSFRDTVQLSNSTWSHGITLAEDVFTTGPGKSIGSISAMAFVPSSDSYITVSRPFLFRHSRYRTNASDQGKVIEHVEGEPQEATWKSTN